MAYKILFSGPGDTIHLKKWMSFFHDNGWQIYWFGFNADFPSEFDWITEKFPISTGTTVLQTILQYKKILKKINPDIINLHYFQSYQIFSLFTPRNIPLVLCGWGNDILIDPFNSILHKFLLKLTCARVNKIVSIAGHMTKVLINKIGVLQNKIITSFWGYDSKIFYNQNLKKNDDIIRIINPRGFSAIYNWKTCIEAIPKVLKKNKDYKFIFTNGGEDEDYAKNLIIEYGIEKNVEILDRISQDELATELNKSHIFLSLSLSDGNLISLNEAMACGLFPVCSNTPATRQWLLNNKNGFILNDNLNPDELAEKILNVDMNSELVNQAISENYTIVKEKADFYINLKKILNLFEKLINQ